MPINNITQTISTIPPAGARGVDVQSIFVAKQEDFQDHLQGITVTELNTLKGQLNTRIGEINSTVTTMNGYADTASAGASTATTKAEEASTSATAALNSKNQASIFATNSSNSATKSSQWADNNYNVAVEAGKYSAKHWSTVAQNATVNKVDKVTSTDNAIVRFDGTTGVVQNSAITIDDNGNVGGGTQSFNGFGGSGFKNLIINGNKQVNQSRLTTTDNAYNYDNHYKVGNNWFQFISGKNIVSGESYTLSWEGSATAGYYIGTAGALTINAQTFIPIANGETITLTITSGQILWIKFASNSSGSTYSKVQLEPGTVPTPFEHRLYQLEESLVQRVYEHEIISALALSANVSYNGGISNAYFKTTKDIVPQIVITTNTGSKSAKIMAVNTNVVQFTPTVQASVNDFIYVVVNIDARPY